MKLIHLSDLHLGKRVNEFSLLNDQQYILMQIIDIIDEQNADGVIIAGDVYDKSIPSAEAVELFDDFLCRLAKKNLQVFIISGNHDSAERIAFGGRLMDKSGVHLSPVYCGCVEPITLSDEFGKINLYLLPFIKPANVRRFFPEAEISSYTDAIKTAVESMNINENERNILVTHQFVTGANTCDSEEATTVGNLDNVDAAAFCGFDYVALGHIHRPQSCSNEHIRYCGTPLKYSFSEINDEKSVTVVELKEKGNIELSFVPLTPKRDMVEIKGTYDQLMLKSFYENTTYTKDYVHIILTDEQDVPNANAKLRVIYKNMMKLTYDNTRTRHSAEICGNMASRSKSPFENFAEFFEMLNGQAMSNEQSEFVKELINQTWEEQK